MAEQDPAWEKTMEEEAKRGKNLMVNSFMLKSRSALAELTLTQQTTTKLQ
jgi:hypothetical protein